MISFQNMPESWKKAAHFFDLPDFLTWKATGSLSRLLFSLLNRPLSLSIWSMFFSAHRSSCSLVCKWTYLLGSQDDASVGWQKDFFDSIGLSDLCENDFCKIGKCSDFFIPQQIN